MLKYIIISFLLVGMMGCSNDAQENSTNDAKSLSISRAPTLDKLDIKSVLSVEFSEDMDLSSLTTLTSIPSVDQGVLDGQAAPTYIRVSSSSYPLYLKDSSGSVVGVTLTIDDANPRKVLITPFKYLSASSSYTLVVTTAVKSASGNSLSEDYTLSFTPADDGSVVNPGTALYFSDSNPQDVSTPNVLPLVSIEFDSTIAVSDLPMFSVIDGNNTSVSGTFEYFNAKVTFTPTLPLSAGTSYTVTMQNPPTDMFGNAYDTQSPTTWNFTVSGFLLGPSTMTTSVLVDTGDKSAYMVRAFKDNIDGIVDIVAVAREGGIDFYEYTNAASSAALSPAVVKKASYSITSKINDMVYVDNNSNFHNNLIVATENDGIFIIDIDATGASYVVNAHNYMQTVTGITGVGYGSDLTNIDRVYAVGPKIGLKVFDSINGSANLLPMPDVSIDGTPLKLTGYNNVSRYLYISDYDNGLRVYDENGTTSYAPNIMGSRHLKYVHVVDNSGPNFAAINSIGNIRIAQIGNPSIGTNPYSSYREIRDASQAFTSSIVLAVDTGLYFFNPASSYFIPVTGGLISAVNLISSTSDIIGLDNNGVLYAFWPGA